MIFLTKWIGWIEGSGENIGERDGSGRVDDEGERRFQRRENMVWEGSGRVDMRDEWGGKMRVNVEWALQRREGNEG